MRTFMCYACGGDFQTGYWLQTGPGRDLFYCNDCADKAGIIDHAVRHDDEPTAWQLEDRQYISEATAFDHGDEFESVDQVRGYFTVENLEDMFGSCRFTQEELDLMAEAVIENGWHIVSRMEFAEALGFKDYEALVGASESVVREGDIDWYVTQLPDGRWAAWDDAEVALDRVAYFATREEAETFHRDAYAEKYGEE